MASELEDALRAAAAAAAAATAAAPAAKKGQAVAQGAASPGKKRKWNKRRRQRADSVGSAALSTDDAAAAAETEREDPAARLAAFRARMFDVDAGAATSATFAAFATAPARDDVVAVQWKGKKKKKKTAAKGTPGGGGDNDEDAIVPQLTRAKVVARALQTVQQPATKQQKSPKKNKMQAKASTAPVVHELHVPPPQPAQARQQRPTAQVQRTKAGIVRRDDEALAFSDPSDDDKEEQEQDAAASATALVAATVAAHKAIPSKATPLRKTVDATHAKASKRPVKTAAAAGVGATQKKPSLTQTRNGTATRAAHSTTVASANSVKAESDRNGKAMASARKPAPLQTPLSACTGRTTEKEEDDEEDDERWDLDALVKNTVQKQAKQQRKLLISGDDEADGSDVDDEHGRADDASDFGGKPFRAHQMHLFSMLIDEAARERWELVEVGRLVRIFAAQWSHKTKKTARFLRRCCPELVSVEFLDGLNIPLTATQLLKIFERGSGTPVVVMNKIASAVENASMNVRDEAVQSFIVGHTQTMATNREIVAFLLPLLESLSKVKDVGVLLKAVCEHWHLDRTAALVQEILLTPIFDDLEGQPDVILEDLPMLEGRLDFPSCMDDEDADENGNLKGLIAGENSDLGESDADPADLAEEELGDVESEGEDSHADDDVYEGETDSDEEREARERLSPPKRRRSRFILDEADEDDEEHDEEEDGFVVDDDDEEDDDSDSSGDSSEDDAPAKPQRKRLRRG